MQKEKILIIRHGALGDFILSFGPFQTIRKAWPCAKITLLTTTPYIELAKESGLFDEIWVDPRPKFWQLGKIFSLWCKLSRPHFSWVYDLQTSHRSSLYHNFFSLIGQKPNWSGIKSGCSHPDTNPKRSSIHTLERQKEQLALSGLKDYISGDLSFLKAPIEEFKLTSPYLLIVPGCAIHRPEKRWPLYHKLLPLMIKKGIRCVALGSEHEQSLLQSLENHLTEEQKRFFVNLCGKTSFGHIAQLARHAAAAVGNDTGPMHIISAVHCPSLVLFSKNSNPERCAPRGNKTQIIYQKDLKDLHQKKVWDTLRSMMKFSK